MAVTTRYSNNIDDSVGLPCDLSKNVLPANGDAIRAFYYTRQNLTTAVNKHLFLSTNETSAKLVPVIMHESMGESFIATRDRQKSRSDD